MCEALGQESCCLDHGLKPKNSFFFFFGTIRASDAEVAALENLLTDRIVYTNQHQFRNKLALVDDVGQVIGILDEEDVEVDDQDNVSLCEDKKSPVIIRAIEPQDDNVRFLDFPSCTNGVGGVNRVDKHHFCVLICAHTNVSFCFFCCLLGCLFFHDRMTSP